MSVNGGAVTIVYEADGNRVSKTINGVTTKFLVDDNNPTGYAQVVEEITNGGLSRTYVYGHMLTSQDQLVGGSWALSFYGVDGHGSVRLLLNSSGNVTDSYDYDAFGVLIHQTGTTPNAYLYSGEQFDPDLGLNYQRARYLNVSTGRFWTADRYEGRSDDPTLLHKYVYTLQNPANRVDPSGDVSIGEVLVTLGVAVILASLSIAAFNSTRRDQVIEIDHESVVIAGTKWDSASADQSTVSASSFWHWRAGILLRPRPARVVTNDPLNSIPEPQGSLDHIRGYIDQLLDKIKPTTHHVAVFTGDTGSDDGWTPLGVFPSAHYGVLGLSVISGSFFHPDSFVVAHEWGHTFGIPDPFFLGEFFPNVVNSVTAVPILTTTQRRAAREFVMQHYPHRLIPR